jgi:5-methyltetrahydrofolate--homocysteine methyltransferase
MAELSDITNETIRSEIEEYLERPEEIARNVELFARVRPLMQEIAAAIIEGEHETVDKLTAQALDEGIDALEVMDDGLIAGMGIVGIKFREAFIFVPEVLACARAMKVGMNHIEPILSASGVDPIGTVIMGTVKGDLHDIGKNLVGALLEGAGFEVIDLGVDVAPEKFVETVQETNANIVCLSALLTVTMLSMKATIEGLRAAGLRQQVKVLVGGAPVTRQFAEEIGADGYGENASAAVALARTCAKSAAAG